jgi:Lignostilbene-alpha,beta-dioxygenase and related enzymes
LRRCRIDPRSGTVKSEWLEQRCCEFAMVNPANQGLDARFAWMAVAQRERGNDPLQAMKSSTCRLASALSGARLPAVLSPNR